MLNSPELEASGLADALERRVDHGWTKGGWEQLKAAKLDATKGRMRGQRGVEGVEKKE